MFVADNFMEAKFNSFVESFYLSLSDSQFDKAREQLDLMKKWYEAYESSLQSVDPDQIDKQLLENAPLYKQVSVKSLSNEQILDHCEKKYIDIVFKDYYQYIPQLKSFPSSFWSIYVLHFVSFRSLYIHFI